MINAMSPAVTLSIVVDEESNSMDIAVEEEKLSQAIGRGGQNVKLASELTGWTLNVMTESQAEEKSEGEMRVLQESFMEKLDVDEEVAAILVQEGFSTRSCGPTCFPPHSDTSRISFQRVQIGFR